MSSRLLILFTSALALCTSGAFAAEPGAPTFKRRVETHLRAGADRHLNMTEIWQPLYQENDTLLYASLRSMVDNQDNFEGNIGLGARRFYGDHILGGYGFIDRRGTEMGSEFWQTTWGAEYIRNDLEARANIYLPVNRVRRFSDGAPVTPVVAGTGVYMRGPGEIIEEAQRGIDAEIGFILPHTQDFIGQTRIYGGGYYFHGDKTPDVAGPRARLEVDVASWLQLGGRAQYDDERGAQYFIDATIRFPMKNKNHTGLWARMEDTPERDVDVVTGAVDIPGDNVPVIDNVTGAPVHLIYVDNQTTHTDADGSAEKPFSTLDAGIGTAQSGDIVYVAGNALDTPYSGGQHLTTNQITLIGAGSPLVLNGDHYRARNASWSGDLLLRPSGRHPLLENKSGDGLTINAAHITLAGLHIDNNEGHGIVVGPRADGLSIENTRITGNNGDGILITQGDDQPLHVRIRDSVITGNLLAGIRTETQNDKIHLNLGDTDTYGYNDLYGNIGMDVSAETRGADIAARGNYWGMSAPRLGGADHPRIDHDVEVGQAFCTDCQMGDFHLDTPVDVPETGRQTLDMTHNGIFTGHRYIALSGTGDPNLIQNDTDTGSRITRIDADDELSVAFTSSTLGLQTRDITLSTGGTTATATPRTRFLPNYYGALIGWWDGQDIDGGFNAADPSTSTSWHDKTGYGHNGTATGGDTLRVDHSLYLSALDQGATLAVMTGSAPIAPGAPLFQYGSCTSDATSRCFSITRADQGTNGVFHLSTDQNNNQSITIPNLFNGTAHIIWASANKNGDVTIHVDGRETVHTTYPVGQGFWNTQGILLSSSGHDQAREIMLFNGTVSSDARDRIDDYLTQKWAGR